MNNQMKISMNNIIEFLYVYSPEHRGIAKYISDFAEEVSKMSTVTAFIRRKAGGLLVQEAFDMIDKLKIELIENEPPTPVESFDSIVSKMDSFASENGMEIRYNASTQLNASIALAPR